MKYSLLLKLGFCIFIASVGYKESADSANERQKEILKKFDSINIEIVKSINEVKQKKEVIDTLSDEVKRIKDSILYEARKVDK